VAVGASPHYFTGAATTRGAWAAAAAVDLIFVSLAAE